MKLPHIVCISPAPWDYPIWTNRQHIMSRIAENHPVLYVFQPRLFRSVAKRASDSLLLRMSGLRKGPGNLMLVTAPVLPFSSYSAVLSKLSFRIGAHLLSRSLAQYGIRNYLLWFYDPEAAEYAERLSPVISCYDCVDDFSAMPEYSNPAKRQRLLEAEQRLLKKCDLVFTTSETLFEAKRRINPSTYLIENVGDFDHFNSANSPLKSPEDLPKGYGAVIGFVGAIDEYKVDFSLISALSSAQPNWAIVLIGGQQNSYGVKHTLPSGPNVFFLGRKPYETLPSYVHGFDVCVIPYVINSYTKGVFPIKLFEFLAAGKPVVTTQLPTIEKYRGVISIADTPKDFVRLVGDALYNETAELKEKRIAIARKNTWDARKDKLLAHVKHALQGR